MKKRNGESKKQKRKRGESKMRGRVEKHIPLESKRKRRGEEKGESRLAEEYK